MKLAVVKEVGKSGEGYHLAVGKVIEVSEEEAERLQEEYPGCLAAPEYLSPIELREEVDSRKKKS